MLDITGFLNGEGSLLQSLQNPTQFWDYFKNGRSNIVNKEIATENLNLQKDEQLWQREFAENQRDYERTLQQEIFNREDTAIERQAEQLSKIGINPLTQQMSGLNAGSAVGASNTNSVIPQNGFVMQDKGLMEVISPILSLVNGMSNLNTQGLQRDSIREQNDYQRLLNQEKAIENRFLENKLTQEEEARTESNRHEKEINPYKEKDAKSTAQRNERENQFQNEYGLTDNSSNVARIATDTAKQAERFANGVNQISDKVGDLSKSAVSTLVDSAKKKIKDYGKSLKNTGSKIKNWFKKNSVNEDYLQNNYGF